MVEVRWSRAGPRDYAEFFARVKRHLARLDAAGIKYRTPTDVDRPRRQK